MTEIPNDLHYTKEHEWVLRTGDDTVRVGITDFAQSSLGDVVYVELPQVGAEVKAGESFGTVESPKAASDLYAPVTAKVIAVNGDLQGSPELVNSGPYAEGWLIELQAEPAALDAQIAELLNADGYRDAITE